MCVLFSLFGCAAQTAVQCFEYTYLDAFDTVTVFKLYTPSRETADGWADALHAEMVRLHELFTIYDDAAETVNLKSINEAGGQTTKVPDEIFSLLELGKKAYTLTDGKVNMAMGGVLRLWHTARTAALEDAKNAYLPSKQSLKDAFVHCDIQDVILDVSEKTVRLSDSVLLDVGAFAKGYAVQLMADYAKEMGVANALLSVGGNVVAIGDKVGSPYRIGIEDPANPQSHLHVVNLKDRALVTSGNYQRYFTVDGVQYHHLIDPDTLYPANLWASVSVIGPDSGMADVLSTALFLLPQENGAALLKTAGDYEAVWVNHEGACFYSENFKTYLD